MTLKCSIYWNHSLLDWNFTQCKSDVSNRHSSVHFVILKWAFGFHSKILRDLKWKCCNACLAVSLHYLLIRLWLKLRGVWNSYRAYSLNNILKFCNVYCPISLDSSLFITSYMINRIFIRDIFAKVSIFKKKANWCLHSQYEYVK